MVPHSKQTFTVAASPRASSLPFSVALSLVISPAALVVTEGGTFEVVKASSDPAPAPYKPPSALARK